MSSPFLVGNNVVIRAEFTEWNESTEQYEPANPTAATVTVKPPNSAAVDYDLTTTGTLGEYTATVALTEAGAWHYRVNGTGAVVAVQDGRFSARNPNPTS